MIAISNLTLSEHGSSFISNAQSLVGNELDMKGPILVKVTLVPDDLDTDVAQSNGYIKAKSLSIDKTIQRVRRQLILLDKLREIEDVLKELSDQLYLLHQAIDQSTWTHRTLLQANENARNSIQNASRIAIDLQNRASQIQELGSHFNEGANKAIRLLQRRIMKLAKEGRLEEVSSRGDETRIGSGGELDPLYLAEELLDDVEVDPEEVRGGLEPSLSNSALATTSSGSISTSTPGIEEEWNHTVVEIVTGLLEKIKSSTRCQESCLMIKEPMEDLLSKLARPVVAILIKTRLVYQSHLDKCVAAFERSIKDVARGVEKRKAVSKKSDLCAEKINELKRFEVKLLEEKSTHQEDLQRTIVSLLELRSVQG